MEAGLGACTVCGQAEHDDGEEGLDGAQRQDCHVEERHLDVGVVWGKSKFLLE